MPEMSGPELVSRARAHPAADEDHLHVGLHGRRHRPSGDAGRGLEFLPKPIGLDTLVRELREVLNGRGRAPLAEAAR